MTLMCCQSLWRNSTAGSWKSDPPDVPAKGLFFTCIRERAADWEHSRTLWNGSHRVLCWRPTASTLLSHSYLWILWPGGGEVEGTELCLSCAVFLDTMDAGVVWTENGGRSSYSILGCCLSRALGQS